MNPLRSKSLVNNVAQLFPDSCDFLDCHGTLICIFINCFRMFHVLNERILLVFGQFKTGKNG